MASSVLRGQTALCTLQPVPHSESVEESMSTYSLPVQLKIAESNGRKKGTASGFLGNGMDVYKVSKVGLISISERFVFPQLNLSKALKSNPVLFVSHQTKLGWKKATASCSNFS